jgi:anti-sigma regulatory factor (Ser/Thr protein kinase)
MEQELRPVPDSVREARLAVGSALSEAGYRGDRDLALLLTSEVVTNAVRHAATPITLSVMADAEAVQVRVADADPSHLPVLRTVDGHRDPGGRGLHILDRMSRDWGVDTDRHSKTVWFTVA